MANGAHNDMSFEEYKKLTEEERGFFIFDKLCKIDKVCTQLDSLDEKYAAKWIEKGAKIVGAVGLTTVVGSIASMFFHK